MRPYILKHITITTIDDSADREIKLTVNSEMSPRRVEEEQCYAMPF